MEYGGIGPSEMAASGLGAVPARPSPAAARHEATGTLRSGSRAGAPFPGEPGPK